jgi:hypothetical protein
MQQIGAFRSAALIVRFTAAVVVLHGTEILLWACFYRWRCLPSWNSAIYFSASSYSTLGCNDVSLPSMWRTLGPLESIIGVLMCGISVSLLFAIVTRLTSHNAGSSRKEDRTNVSSLLPELEELPVKKDAKERVSLQRRDNPGISAERLTRGVTGDGVRTIVGICVALLIVSAGLAAAYIFCVRLLILLVSVSAFLLLHFSPL